MELTLQTNTARTARVNGIELGYQAFGRGKPGILLHGGFGSVEMYALQAQGLASRDDRRHGLDGRGSPPSR